MPQAKANYLFKSSKTFSYDVFMSIITVYLVLLINVAGEYMF